MKALSLILGIVAILAAAGTGYFYMETQSAKEEKTTAIAAIENEMAQVQADANDLKSKLNALETENDQLEKTKQEQSSKITRISGTLSDLQSKADRLESELKTAKATIEEREKQIADFKKEIVNIKMETTKAPETTTTVDNTSAEASQLAADLQEKLSAAEEKIASLEQSLNTAQSQLENFMQVKRTPGPAGGDSGRIDAISSSIETVKVLEAKPKAGLVLVDFGRNRGAVQGTTIDLQQDNQVVAKIRLTEVMDDMSVANILPSSPKASTLKEGAEFITIR